MPGGVTRERDEQDARAFIAEYRQAVEPEPGTGLFVMDYPLGGMSPMGPLDAYDVIEGQARMLGCPIFRGVDVYLGPGEIGQASVVVDMDMSEHDVAQVLGCVAEGGKLAQGSVAWVTGDVVDPEQETHPRRRLGIVAAAQPGIDQNQTVVCLQQQAVGDLADAGLEGHAVEVVNDH